MEEEDEYPRTSVRMICRQLKELCTIDPIRPGHLLVLLVSLGLLMQVHLLLLMETLLLLKCSEYL